MKVVLPVLLTLGLVFSAACGGDDKPKTVDATKPPKAEGAPPEGGAVGLSLDLPEGWKAYPQADRTDYFAGLGQHFSLWTPPAGTSEEDALAAVATTIAPAVRDFEVVSEEDVEIAGMAAHHVSGKGVEADDGDPSLAEVYLFTVADRVRVVCIHGEGKATEILRPDVLKILATLKPQ